MIFTHFVKDYILQGGKPLFKDKRLRYSLPPEFTQRSHERGVLGMARWEDTINPERRSSGSEFHVLLSKAKHMNGSYTVFGSLIRGWRVLDSLSKGDTINDVLVYVRADGSRGTTAR